jgi:hypothetical protein
MAANSSKETTGDPSRLLALPIELLQRIADNVSNETLTTFRLTCKPIEAATFDQFAKIFFEERHCCIYYKPRWTLLRDIVFSRMGDKIRRLVFTTDVLAPAMVDHLQLAPRKIAGEDCNSVRAQFNARNALKEALGARTQLPAWPSNDFIGRCLIHIRNLTPDVFVEVDFHDTPFFENLEESTSMKANVLVALAASRMKLAAFETSSLDILQVNETVETLGYDLSSRMRSIQRFSLKGSHLDREARPLIYKFLESAIELRDLELRLNCSGHDAKTPSLSGSKLLSGSNVSRLEVLTLESLTIEVVDLVTVLSRCKSTLLEVRLSYVCVLGSDNVWRQVFDTLVMMPHLSKVRLTWLQQTLSDVVASHFNFDISVSRTWTADEGRGQLTAGLREDLAAMAMMSG